MVSSRQSGLIQYYNIDNADVFSQNLFVMRDKNDFNDKQDFLLRLSLRFQSSNLDNKGKVKNIGTMLPMSMTHIEMFDIGKVVSLIGGYAKVVAAITLVFTSTYLSFYLWYDLAEYFVAKE